MSENKDGRSIRTKILSVISIVMGAFCASIFFLIALICFSFEFEYRKSAIGCLILAAVYVFLGIIIRNVFIRRKERAASQILGVILSVLLVPSTGLAGYAMFSFCFRPMVYDSYEAFAGREEVYIKREYVPDYAQDSKYLKRDDGHVNAVSFKIAEGNREKYEKEEYDWAVPYDENRGISIDEYIKEYAITDVKNTKDAIIPLIGDDDINDYEVLDSTFGNEWAHARFVNRKTGRYIIVVTRYGPG